MVMYFIFLFIIKVWEHVPVCAGMCVCAGVCVCACRHVCVCVRRLEDNLGIRIRNTVQLLRDRIYRWPGTCQTGLEPGDPPVPASSALGP